MSDVILYSFILTEEEKNEIRSWNNTTPSIDEDGYPYPAITESN